jgi:CheY-like chemotaxis protein
LSETPGAVPRVAIVADDLIWATRLAELVRRAGGDPVPARSLAALVAVLPGLDGCLVDLTSRAYDGLGAVRTTAEAGVPVVAVAQHDDAPLRAAARDAGAGRVYAYRVLAEHGDRELRRWFGALGAGTPIE